MKIFTEFMGGEQQFKKSQNASMLKEKDVSRWKKSKEITGVSVGSIIDFKAIVAQEQADISSGKSKVRRVEGQTDVKQNKGRIL